MWRCANCYGTFEEPGYIGDLNGTTCPFCGSSLILDGHEMPAEHQKMDDFFDDYEWDDDDHQNCHCYENIVECNGVWKEVPALSFDDMDKHEVLLIGLPPLWFTNVSSACYIPEMNERFLHTFIDANFVPAV